MRKVIFIAFVLVVIAFLVLIFFPIPGSVGGAIGLRSMTHRCIGITIDAQSEVIKNLPKANLEIGPFVYWIPDDYYNRRTFCLGRDVWYGE